MQLVVGVLALLCLDGILGRGIEPHKNAHVSLVKKLSDIDSDENYKNTIDIMSKDQLENEVIKEVDDESEDDSVLDNCDVGNDLHPMGVRAIERHYSHVFPAMQMKCDGRISSWEYYSRGKGVFYASIWREEGVGHYVLVGKNLINSTSIGRQIKEISSAKQIDVQKGDVIGIFYPRKLIRHQNTGVVAHENQLLQKPCGEYELSWVKNWGRDVSVGEDIRFDLMSYRRAAIKANLDVNIVV